MKRIFSKANFASALAIAGMLAVGPAIADKPSWAGGGKGGEKSEKGQQKGNPGNSQGGQQDGDGKSRHEGPGSSVQMRGYFGDPHRSAAHDYYRNEFQRGHCPPGLAKKNNGCMPPGQAKKWAVGRPLPRNVIFYDVPPALVVQFGHPPSGYRYVRVASDILLIAIGTGMVIDAIQDLGRM